MHDGLVLNGFKFVLDVFAWAEVEQSGKICLEHWSDVNIVQVAPRDQPIPLLGVGQFASLN